MRCAALIACAHVACGPSLSSPPPMLEPAPARLPVPERKSEPLLTAGGVIGCARLGAGTWCWGSWADDVPSGADFDPAAPRALAPDVEALALGWTHGCARHAGGSVRCFGRLGRSAAPAEIPALHQAHAIASGRDFTCGIDRTRRLVCVANRVYTGLRSHSGPPAEAAVAVDGVSGLRQIAATSSAWQLCVAGDRAWCWRSLDHPPAHIDLPSGIEQIALAPDLGCARQASGEVSCWRLEGRTWGPARRIERLRADEITGTHDRICARDESTWSCWRAGEPPRAWTAMRGAVRVAGGFGFVCGIWPDDAIRCTGDASYGQLGPYGSPPPPSEPPARRTPATDVVGMAMGDAHACALRSDQSVVCWGDNAMGQLGDGTAISRRVAVPVRGIHRVVQISAGNRHSCARGQRGDVWCWGAMTLDHGEDVDPVTYSIGARPRRLARRATDLVSGAHHACARTTESELRCWGSQWALSAPTSKLLSLIALPADTRGIAAGGEQTCAIDASGEARCIGRGSGGAAGDRFVPAPESSNITAIAPGAWGCALRRDGALRCWGSNGHGQLGDGSRTSRQRPVSAVGVTNAIQVARGDQHACALLHDGHVQCWGANDRGQLGDGTFRDRWRPTRVPGLAGVTAIAAGGAQTCALLSDQRMECWGTDPTQSASDNQALDPDDQLFR
jgi:alpha-tubulin suppressor-like RCC1 family protein